jgi:hypothetical protein
MIPQILVAGLWFYKDDRNEPFYIGHVNNQTACLLRKVENGHDSAHSLFNYLQGIPLDYDIMIESFGFYPITEEVVTSRSGYVYRKLYDEIKVLRGDSWEVVKPATYMYIDIDELGKRYTTYISCGENKIFVSELSTVHELQLFIFAHTFVFPIITINKLKP